MALGAPWREDSGPTTENGSSSGWIRIEGEGSPPDNRVAQVPTKPSMAAMERRLAVLGHESGNATDAQLLAFEDTWRWGPSAEGPTPT